MTDGNEGGDQPQENPVDLDALISKMNDQNEKRFRGFQSSLDQRFGDLEKQMSELKTASLSPEEQEQFETDKVKAELERYKRQVEILSMRKDFPDEVDTLMGLLEGQSLSDQLQLLRTFRAPAPEQDPDTGEPEAQPTPVDRNNPPRKTEPDLSAMKDKDARKRILEASGNEAGILRRLRRGG